MRGMFINMLPPPQMLAAARAALFAGALVLPAVSHAQNAETDCPQVETLIQEDPSMTTEEKIQALTEALSQQNPCHPGGGISGEEGGNNGAGAEFGDIGTGLGDGAIPGDAPIESQAVSDAQGDLAEYNALQTEKLADLRKEIEAKCKNAGDFTAWNEKMTKDKRTPAEKEVLMSVAKERGYQFDRQTGKFTEIAQTGETAAARASDASRRTGQPGGRTDELPPDIPASEAANDDIIAKQFREAAERETDPKARAELWNTYRRYKGLPTQPAPEDS